MSTRRFAPPPTRFGPPPSQRRVAQLPQRPAPPAPPPTRFQPRGAATLQGFFSCCMGGRQQQQAPQQSAPQLVSPPVRPRVFDAVGERLCSKRAYDRVAEEVSFGFLLITICTAIYIRRGDACAAAHVSGVTYSSAQVKTIVDQVGMNGTNTATDAELRVYFSVGEGSKPLDQLEARYRIAKFREDLESDTQIRPIAYFLYDSKKVKLRLDGNGNPLDDQHFITPI